MFPDQIEANEVMAAADRVRHEITFLRDLWQEGLRMHDLHTKVHTKLITSGVGWAPAEGIASNLHSALQQLEAGMEAANNAACAISELMTAAKRQLKLSQGDFVIAD